MPKSFFFFGISPKDDGHKRITKSEHFTLLGGTAQSHEAMTEIAIKVEEKLKRRPNPSLKDFEEVLHEAQEKV